MSQFKFAGMEGAESATITAFFVKIGQVVKVGDKLFDIEADKASDTVISQVAGTISKIYANVGDLVQIGDVIFDFATSSSENEVSTTADIKSKNQELEPIATNLKTTSTSNQELALKPEVTKQILATPLARKVAANLGVDLALVKGTGPNGRVLRSDIEQYHQAKTSEKTLTKVITAPSTNNIISKPCNVVKIDSAKITSFGEIEHIPLTGIRKAIAQQMSLSKYTAPHVSLMIDVDATNLINLRASMKEEVIKPENGAVKLTFMPFFIKAIAKALSEERFKLLNATLDSANNEILVKKYYNIGVAIDTEKGLVVAVIKDVNKMTLLEVATNINTLAAQARKGQLKGNDMVGGTFTVTNFGSAGLKYGTPIINYPEVAILGIGALEAKVAEHDGKLVLYKAFPLSLSIDHRVIDGAPAGYFMQRIKNLLENPALIMA